MKLYVWKTYYWRVVCAIAKSEKQAIQLITEASKNDGVGEMFSYGEEWGELEIIDLENPGKPRAFFCRP